MHLHEASPGVVVDGHVGELPPRTLDPVAPVAGDAVARPHDASELLGVDVQQLTRRSSLVTHDQRGRLERLQARQAERLERSADGGNAAADDSANRAHGHASAAQPLDPLDELTVETGTRLVGPGALIEQTPIAHRLEALLPL